MYLIKLGGSVVTVKSKPFTFRQAVTNRLVKELRYADKKIVVHGGGSFGHFAAKKYFYGGGGLQAAKVQYHMRELNTRILNCMLKNGLNAVSIPPSAGMVCENGDIVEINIEIFSNYLDAGCIPVTFGDLVLDRTRNFSIISGDTLMVALAKAFKPKKTIFVIDADGIYKNGTLLRDVSVTNLNTEDITDFFKPKVDVTGGIKTKLSAITAIARIGCEVEILNGLVKGRLKKVLLGESIKSTRVVA